MQELSFFSAYKDGLTHYRSMIKRLFQGKEEEYKAELKKDEHKDSQKRQEK